MKLANTTKSIEVYDDGCSIKDSNSNSEHICKNWPRGGNVKLTRGTWNPDPMTRVETELDIAKFINGATVKTSSGGVKTYTRNVTVWRQYGGTNSCSEQNGNACSSQKVKVSVKYTPPKEGEPELYIQKKDIYEDDDIGDAYKVGSGAGWKEVTYKGMSGYKFIGWKTSDNEGSGTDGIITRTRDDCISFDSDRKCVVSGGNAYATYVTDDYDTVNKHAEWSTIFYKNDSRRKIYTKVHALLKKKDRTILAYYAKVYDLSINNDNTTVTVNRELSDYAKRTTINASSNIYYDDYLDICAKAGAGYTFKELKINGVKQAPYGDCDGGKAYDFWVSGDTIISAKAERDEFKGLSRAADALNNSSNESTDWKQVNYTANKYVIDCNDPVNGCPVVIAQHLKRVGGSGTTTNGVVSVTKSWGVADGIPCYKPNGICEQGAADNGVPGDVGSSANGSDITVSRNMYRLKPGQMVCETFEFKPFPADSGKASLKSCAYAVGSASTSLGIKVKNAGVPKYSNYDARDVYAKPGDKIYYQATYDPIPQYAYTIVPEKVQINSGPIYPDGDKNTTRYLGKRISSMNLDSMFKLYSSNNWGNGFSIQIDGKSVLNESYTLGDTSRKTSRGYNYNNVLGGEVSKTDVGKSIRGQAVTNPSNVFGLDTTPKSVTFYMNSGYNVGNVDTDSVESNTVFAKVPYNFNNTTKIAGLKSGGNVVYAGESATIKYNINVGVRTNAETNGTYSTIVRNAKRQLIMCEGVGCTRNASSNTGVVNTTLNSGGLTNGRTDLAEDTKNIPDIPAGSWMCFKSRVYPATVLNDITVDTEWRTNELDYGWAESDEQCYQVAKRPSFQVWGGSVYSAGKVDLNGAVSNKKRLAGYSDGTFVFGPWTELGLVASGSVTGLASGAGLGYAQISDAGSAMRGGGSSVGGLGGSHDTSFCKISTLSFANMNCGSSVGDLSKNGSSSDRSALLVDFSNASDDKYILIDKGGEDVQTSSIDVGNTSDYNGDWVIEDGEVKNIKRTKIIKTSGKVTINRSITYDNNDYTNSGYQKIEDIPKIIIYAHDIEITCTVKRVDAVLIAENSINTCSDVDESRANTSRENSNQLVINGATISNKLILNRTYGAATGVNSIIPAEIINYDSSLYLWGSKQADMTNSGELTEASIRELAPRY